jgi:hypothetical protein
MHKREYSRMVTSIGIGGFFVLIAGGCTTPTALENRPIADALIGKTRHELLSCAGNPLRETPLSDGTVLRYYKEAPMLVESFVGSKGSKPGVHHGCWANVMLSGNQVAGIEYLSVPDPKQAGDHCEEIFVSCVR